VPAEGVENEEQPDIKPSRPDVVGR